ncbi:MAG: calcium-binding protein [Xenococcaceae cyanobacterium MO_188.B19]|nr:calcium-binding protein [Xenococcaceae cyanobacterium MO_188.B19]
MSFPTNFVNDFTDRNFSDDNLTKGTNQNDLIVADFGNDIIHGLLGNDDIYGNIGNDKLYGDGGNDKLIGSFGNDLLDGGSGIDTADYSGLNTAITLEAVGVVNKGINGQDTIANIERIIGAVGQDNSIDGSTGISPLTSFNVNLEQEKLTVQGIPELGNVDFTIENFVNVTGTSQNDTIKGDSNNNILEGGKGADLFIGSAGNDIIAGNNEAGIQDNADDTIRYQGFGITLKTTGTVEKNGVGTDQLVRVETIEGDVNENNSIDGSDATGASFNVDLGNQFLNISVIDGPVLDRTVINFKNVIGTSGADTIVDSNLSNDLQGGKGEDTITTSEGNDTVSGGKGNDIIVADLGQDVLSGGDGKDLFVLEKDGQVSFTKSGDDDFAIITDFETGVDKIELLGSSNDYDFTLNASETLIANNNDLIAVVQGDFNSNTDVEFV